MLLASLFATSPARAADPKGPDVLFADDQREDTIAPLGNPHIKTPKLDRLVKRGAINTTSRSPGTRASWF